MSSDTFLENCSLGTSCQKSSAFEWGGARFNYKNISNFCSSFFPQPSYSTFCFGLPFLISAPFGTFLLFHCRADVAQGMGNPENVLEVRDCYECLPGRSSTLNSNRCSRPVSQLSETMKSHLFVQGLMLSWRAVRQPWTGSWVQAECACLHCSLGVCSLKLAAGKKSRLQPDVVVHTCNYFSIQEAKGGISWRPRLLISKCCPCVRGR